MGNHNILITNPKGERRHQFIENQLMRVCRDWMDVYGTAPIGWNYQIVNLNKKARKNLDHILIRGYGPNRETGDIELLDERKARVKHNNGRWYTPRMAKRDARAQGAIWFSREKVYEEQL